MPPWDHLVVFHKVEVDEKEAISFIPNVCNSFAFNIVFPIVTCLLHLICNDSVAMRPRHWHIHFISWHVVDVNSSNVSPSLIVAW